MQDISIAAEKIIELRCLMRDFDEYSKAYQHVPSPEPGLKMLESMQERINGFVRLLVNTPSGIQQ